MFLSQDDLQQLTGYQPCQRVRTCRWLKEHGIPYSENRLGEPVVLRCDVEGAKHGGSAPNFDFLMKTA
ncbi:MAG: hypothetical protein CML03_01055 [Pseudooceanicola sp.]|nr:hypothetical protein [Pseudooceanicola sp.]|tara:strand:+ start:8030 stop:8233 length:204 start_codon:yes stop_codon:yes gene_type:complete